MKKLFAVLLLVTVFTATGALVSVPASAVSAEQKAAGIVNEILPEKVIQGSDNKAAVPTGDLKMSILPSAIKILLGIAGSVAFGVFVFAGIKMVISQGNEEDLTKAKNIFIWSLIGLAFITAAYALVRGIMQLAF